MTLKIEDEYPGRSIAATSEYPGGSFKNRSPGEGSDDGTPFHNSWPNDDVGDKYALFRRAKLTANGDVSTAIDSQIERAIGIIAHENGTCPPQSTNRCSPFLYYQWANPGGAPNAIATGLTIRDSAVGWDDTTETPFLWVLSTGGDIYKVTGAWDFYSSPVLSSSVSLAYPSTPDDVFSVCEDGGYLYVVWSDDTSTPGNYQVTKFDAYTLAEVWTSDTGKEYQGAEGVKIINCSTDSCAISIPLDTISEPWRGIIIVAKSSGSALFGTGSWVSGSGDSTDYKCSKLVSNGSHVFWIGFQDNSPSANEWFLHSASISDPTTSSYSSVSLVTTEYWYEAPTGILRLGQNIITSTVSGEFRLTVISSGATVTLFTVPSDFVPYATVGDAYDSDIGFDGMNVWVRLLRQDASSAQDTMLLQIPAMEFGARAEYLSTPERTFPTHHIELNSAVTAYPVGHMMFDGNDLWLALRGGTILRIANPGAR
jgi:hypothetical protein